MENTIDAQYPLASLNGDHANGDGNSEDKTPDSEGKPVYSASFPDLVDIVEKDGKSAFFIKEPGEFKIQFEITQKGETIRPPVREKIPWLLPRINEVTRYRQQYSLEEDEVVDRNLFEDLIAYHKGISELPSEAYYVLLAAWDMHTYLLESFQYSPYILFFAVPERGKSRTGKGMIYVAFRGIHTPTLNQANLFRWSNDAKATLFFDVEDLCKTATRVGAEDVLLLRCEKGAKVARVLNPEHGPWKDTRYFDVYGASVIATNEDVDHILATRSIPITMHESTRQFPEDVTPEKALPLKERLTAFRSKHLWEKLPLVDKPASNRLGDIVRPLLQIVHWVAPHRETEFLNLIGEIEIQRKETKSEELDAQIVRVLCGLEVYVKGGYLPIELVTDGINVGRDERYKISPQRIGRRLKAMTFEKGRGSNGAHTLRYDKAKIDRLALEYGVASVKESSVNPDSPVTPAKVTGVSDVSEVSNRLSKSESGEVVR